MTSRSEQIIALNEDWQKNSRWNELNREYSAEDVVSLRPSLLPEHTIARYTAEKMWQQLSNKILLNSFGALTGSQAVEMVKAGLNSIYVSGWQVAADNNVSKNTYPDQSLYPANSVPQLVQRINNALMRADQITASEGNESLDWYVPILADAEAGFGGPLNAFELMRSMIMSGAAAVHFEDQLAAEKKCGHLGGKVLVPTSAFIKVLKAARLAADVLNVPTVLVARTDALSAKLCTSDIDEQDQKFMSGDRTEEGYYRLKSGLESAIARSLAYAPYADLLWFETSTPDIDEAKEFAQQLRAKFPNKIFAYNCSPSFNWKRHLDDKSIASFREQLADMGYHYQFITLAGWHMINLHSFELAQSYKKRGMSAYVDLQEQEFSKEEEGYTATKHQREVGTGYFDKVIETITSGTSSTKAYSESTEAKQFK